MKAAIIGLGVIGKVHEKVIKLLGYDVVALCDVDESKLTGYEGVQKYTDYKAMLDEVKIDVVHICTPHHLHAQMVIDALERDINVLCEKPLCINLEDIDRILIAEKNSKGQLGVSHQNRYNKENIFLKDYLKDKKDISGYGTLVWRRGADYYAQAEWRGKWATEGGGVLINQALHTLDILIWLIGMPEYVTGMVGNMALKDAIEVEDTACIKCEGNANFCFYATNGSVDNLPVTVTLAVDGKLVEARHCKVSVGEESYQFPANDHINGKACYGTGHEALMEDFYDCVRTGRKFSINGQEASKVIRVILATYKSNGQKIKV